MRAILAMDSSYQIMAIREIGMVSPDFVGGFIISDYGYKGNRYGVPGFRRYGVPGFRRSPEGKPEIEKKWLPMRKGIADLHRRAEVSKAANDRYLHA
ncbi:MAG: hypothetical protein H7834_16140, partial [Magnetococcus sp. YQC-9]